MALLLVLASVAVAQEIRWTEGGYVLAAVNAQEERLVFDQVMQEENGLVSNIGVRLTMLTPDGAELWSIVIDGDGTDKVEQALATEDGWIVAGSSASSDLGDNWHGGWYDAKEPKTDGWVARLNRDGEVLWSRNYGGSDWDSFHAICDARDGGWVAAGNTYSSDGDVRGWHDSGDLFTQPDGWLVHLDAAGDIVWQLALGGSGYDELLGVQAVPGGYIAAGIAGSLDGDVSGPLGPEGDRDAWLVFVSMQGELVWEKSFGGKIEDGFVALAKGPDGLLAAGTNWSFAEGENRDEVAWAMGFTLQGEALWSIRFGGEGSEYPGHAAWATDFWAISGFNQVGEEEREWLVAIPASGSEWKVFRGEL